MKNQGIPYSIKPGSLATGTKIKFGKEHFFWNRHPEVKGNILFLGTINKCDRCNGPMHLNAAPITGLDPDMVSSAKKQANDLFKKHSTIPETSGYDDETDEAICDNCYSKQGLK